MHRVILLSSVGPEGPMGHPSLKGDEVKMKHFTYLGHAFKAAENMGSGLILCEQVAGREEMLKFLQMVAPLSGEKEAIRAICCWKEAAPEDLPSFVKASLPFPPPPEDYGNAIAECLRPRIKEGKRNLVRLWVHGQEKPLLILCTAIDAGFEGMTVESNKTLGVGKVYDVQFLGLSVPIPVFQARILSQSPGRAGLSLHYYTAAFEGMLPSKKEALARGLKLELPAEG